VIKFGPGDATVDKPLTDLKGQPAQLKNRIIMGVSPLWTLRGQAYHKIIGCTKAKKSCVHRFYRDNHSLFKRR
jgi:hypothetical protein